MLPSGPHCPLLEYRTFGVKSQAFGVKNILIAGKTLDFRGIIPMTVRVCTHLELLVLPTDWLFPRNFRKGCTVLPVLRKCSCCGTIGQLKTTSSIVESMNGPNPKNLFKEKFGTVWVTIYGPAIGWEWSQVQYFRLVRNHNDPSKWERRAPDREVDQKHLRKANAAVIEYYAKRAKRRKENLGHGCFRTSWLPHPDTLTRATSVGNADLRITANLSACC